MVTGMLIDVASLLLISALSILNGNYIIARFSLVMTENFILNAVHSFVLGIIVFVYLFNLLGLIELLYPGIIEAIILMNVVLHFGRVIRVRYKAKGIPNRSIKFKNIISLTDVNWKQATCGMVSVGIGAYLPFTKIDNAIFGYDSLAYHVYQPYRALYITHGLDARDLIPNAGISLAMNSIYGYLSTLGSPQSVMYFQFLLFIVLCVLLYQMFKNYSFVFRVSTFISSIALLLALGPTTISSPGTDLQMCLILVICADCFLRIRRQEKVSLNQLVYAAVLIGFLPIVKLFSIPYVLVFVVIILMEIRRDLLPVSKSRMITLIGIVIAPSSVWFIKNWVQAGNPFFPTFRKLFGGVGYARGVWTEEDDLGQSFAQSIQVIRSCKPSSFVSSCGGLSQYAIYGAIAGLIFISIFLLRTPKQGKLIATLLFAVMLGMVAVLGITPRYFVGILVFQICWNTHYKDREKRSENKINQNFFKEFLGNLLFVALLGVTVSYFGIMSGWSNNWKTIPASSNERYRSYTGQNELDLLVDYMQKSESIHTQKVCLIGDGRAFVFWPLDILVIPKDNRNPFFSNQDYTDLDINLKLESIGCEYLIYTNQWDRSRKLSTLEINFIQGKSEQIQYRSENFLLIQLGDS